MASDALSFMDSQAFQNFSDVVAGFGDAVTFDGTTAIHELMGTSSVINKCSTSYKVGGWTGVAGSFVTPAGFAKQGGTTIGKSFINVFKGAPKGKTVTGLPKNGSKTHFVGSSGDRYGDIVNDLQGVLRNNHLEINHMPSAKWNSLQVNGLSHKNGGAILMEKSDHKLTRTYGNPNKKISREESNLSFKEVYSRDIKDIKSNFGNKYNKAIKQTTKYYKKIGVL